MKRLIFMILVVSGTLTLGAQDAYEAVLAEIESNSLTLSVLREKAEAEKLGANTGRYPANPEVEFGYLWGSPVTIGNRIDYSVTQTIDFPTVYGRMGDIAEQETVNAELRYRTARTSLLLEAREVLVNLVYYNALAKEYALRLENAEAIASSFRSQLDQGAVNTMENNKAQVNLATVRNDLAMVELERESLLSKLKVLNGGKEIVVVTDKFQGAVLTDGFEEWYAKVEASSPVLQEIKGESMLAETRVKLESSKTLPKITAGYMSENVVGERFQGVVVGLSVPLWENKNSVKLAKAGAEATKSVKEETVLHYYNTLKSVWSKAKGLQQTVESFAGALSGSDNGGLLLKALDSGEISLLDYLLEMQFYYGAVEGLLGAERDLELALAQLWAAEQ